VVDVFVVGLVVDVEEVFFVGRTIKLQRVEKGHSASAPKAPSKASTKYYRYKFVRLSSRLDVFVVGLVVDVEEVFFVLELGFLVVVEVLSITYLPPVNF